MSTFRLRPAELPDRCAGLQHVYMLAGGERGNPSQLSGRCSRLDPLLLQSCIRITGTLYRANLARRKICHAFTALLRLPRLSDYARFGEQLWGSVPPHDQPTARVLKCSRAGSPLPLRHGLFLLNGSCTFPFFIHV